MSEVIFEDRQGSQQFEPHKRPDFSKRNSKFANYLVKKGWAKDEKSANTRLVIISIILLVVSLFFWIPDLDRVLTPEQTVYREDLTVEQLNSLPAEVINQLPSRRGR